MAVLKVTVSPTALAGGESYLIEATRQLSPGINFVPQSAYRKVKISATTFLNAIAFLSEYVALFGALQVGQKIFIRVSTINSVGQRSVPLESSTIVT